VAQEKQQVDNNALYAVIESVKTDLATKFDKLSGQVGDLRLLVVQGQSAYDAHDLPAKVNALSSRVVELEIANAAERGVPLKVEDIEKRLKTVEKREDEREGRRKLFDTLSVVAALMGGLLTIVQIYQWLKGR